MALKSVEAGYRRHLILVDALDRMDTHTIILLTMAPSANISA